MLGRCENASAYCILVCAVRIDYVSAGYFCIFIVQFTPQKYMRSVTIYIHTHIYYL